MLGFLLVGMIGLVVLELNSLAGSSEMAKAYEKAALLVPVGRKCKNALHAGDCLAPCWSSDVEKSIS
jgi:hypothetical protein